jgi:inner membrane protein
MFKRKDSTIRRRLGWIGIGISTFYLLITVVNKQIAENVFENTFAGKQIEYNRINTRPTPLNSILWIGTIETDKGFYEGTYSLLDPDDNIKFEYFPKNHDLIDHLKKDKDIKKLIYISKGFYTIQPDGKDYLFQDFRYGRVTGWLPGQYENQFTFEYRISDNNDPDDSDNIKIIRLYQKKLLDKEIFFQLWIRILGIRSQIN